MDCKSTQFFGKYTTTSKKIDFQAGCGIGGILHGHNATEAGETNSRKTVEAAGANGLTGEALAENGPQRIKNAEKQPLIVRDDFGSAL